jgi:hypothetical protein
MVTVAEFKLLRQALRSAKLEECSWSKDQKEAASVYLNSWVVSPLQRVIEAIEVRHKRRVEKEST